MQYLKCIRYITRISTSMYCSNLCTQTKLVICDCRNQNQPYRVAALMSHNRVLTISTRQKTGHSMAAEQKVAFFACDGCDTIAFQLYQIYAILLIITVSEPRQSRIMIGLCCLHVTMLKKIQCCPQKVTRCSFLDQAHVWPASQTSLYEHEVRFIQKLLSKPFCPVCLCVGKGYDGLHHHFLHFLRPVGHLYTMRILGSRHHKHLTTIE